MKAKTSGHIREFPATFAQFSELIPPRLWMKRVVKVTEEIRGNRFLRDYLQHEYRVLFALEAMQKAHASLDGQIASSAQYEAVALVTQLVALHGQLDPLRQKALVGRIKGAFQTIDDLRALQFELMVANHFTNRGYDLDLPEARHTGNFDILATRGEEKIEIECKSIALDKGYGIHRREALEFFNLAKQETERSVTALKGGLLMRIVLPGRLPSEYSVRKEICKELHSTLISSRVSKSSLCEIVPIPFDLNGTPFIDQQPDPGRLSSFVEQRFPVQYPQMTCLVNPGTSALVLTVENARAPKLLEAVFDIMSKAAKQQLTGRRPGFICVKFEGITPSQMVEMGEGKGLPTALLQKVMTFFKSEARSHVAGVAFMSGGEVRKIGDIVVTQEGVSYCFDHPEGKFGDVQAFRDLLGN